MLSARTATTSRHDRYYRGLVLAAWACLTAAGCASAHGARPSAFPGAPVAPTAPGVSAPGTSGTAPGDSDTLRRAVAAALEMRGRPYRLGGDDPAHGFDCSGLVQFAFAEAHVAVPRTVAKQAAIGRRVAPDDVAPGDLLFFAIRGHRPTHVGIAIDRTSFVHAPDRGGVVRVERFDTRYWQSKLVDVRRVGPSSDQSPSAAD
jgi:cell wall-associated NlpC family hydrolase